MRTIRRDLDLSGLLRPDGSVVVPGEVAEELLAGAVLYLTAEARRRGLLISARAERILYALHEAAEQHEAATFADEPTNGAPAMVEIDSADAAACMGCTVQHVTRLCRSGRILGRRIGRAWLIDADSLDRYRYRRTP